MNMDRGLRSLNWAKVGRGDEFEIFRSGWTRLQRVGYTSLILDTCFHRQPLAGRPPGRIFLSLSCLSRRSPLDFRSL